MIEKEIYSYNTKEFLNASLDEIYSKRKHFVKGNDLYALKCRVSPFFMQTERLLREVYFSGICPNLEKIDLKLFSKHFPYIFNTFYGKTFVDGYGNATDGVSFFMKIIENLRNVNSHAIINDNLQKMFTVSEEFVSCLPKINENLSLSKNNTLTIAGMFSMLLTLLDLKAREILVKHIVETWSKSLFACEDKKYYEIRREIVEELTTNYANNYEVEIRTSIAKNDIIADIFGREIDNVKLTRLEDGREEFVFDLTEQVNAVKYSAKGTVYFKDEEIELCVFKDSNIGVDFKDNYIISISAKDDFCKFCNMVPPFFAISYLYKIGITRFDKDTVQNIPLDRFKKLNQPKFYRNKNIDILSYGSRNADIREVNRIINDNFITVLLNLEEKLIFSHDIVISQTYSRLSNVLKRINVPETLLNKMIACRNFCIHEGMLNRVSYSNDQTNKYTITFEFLQNTVDEMADFLENTGLERTAIALRNDFHKKVINSIIGSKYKRIIEKSILLFRGARERIEEHQDAIRKNMGLVNVSILTSEIENVLSANRTKRFSFFIAPHILLLDDQQYHYRYLTFIRIIGDGLEVRGVPIGRNSLEFFQTPATVFHKITQNGQQIKLIEEHKESKGLLDIITYRVEPV